MPVIVALRRTGAPSLTSLFSKGTITFGGCICCNSSFFGFGAFNSNGPTCCGCVDLGWTVNLAVVSSVPTGFTARTV